jgi:hypothetical protein
MAATADILPKTRGASWAGASRYRVVIDVDGVETAEAFFTLR